MENENTVPNRGREKNDEDIDWRGVCKQFTYVDMVVLGLGLPSAIMMAMKSVEDGFIIHPLMHDLPEEQMSEMRLCTQIILVMVLVTMSAGGIWSDFILERTTNIRNDAKDSLEAARTWVKIRLGMIGCYFMGAAIGLTTLATCAILVSWHLLVLVVVWRFIRVVKMHIANQSANGNQEQVGQQPRQPQDNVQGQQRGQVFPMDFLAI